MASTPTLKSEEPVSQLGQRLKSGSSIEWASLPSREESAEADAVQVADSRHEADDIIDLGVVTSCTESGPR
jgi:hypothetical protein